MFSTSAQRSNGTHSTCQGQGQGQTLVNPLWCGSNIKRFKKLWSFVGSFPRCQSCHFFHFVHLAVLKAEQGSFSSWAKCDVMHNKLSNHCHHILEPLLPNKLQFGSLLFPNTESTHAGVLCSREFSLLSTCLLKKPFVQWAHWTAGRKLLILRLCMRDYSYYGTLCRNLFFSFHSGSWVFPFSSRLSFPMAAPSPAIIHFACGPWFVPVITFDQAASHQHSFCCWLVFLCDNLLQFSVVSSLSVGLNLEDATFFCQSALMGFSAKKMLMGWNSLIEDICFFFF